MADAIRVSGMQSLSSRRLEAQSDSRMKGRQGYRRSPLQWLFPAPVQPILYFLCPKNRISYRTFCFFKLFRPYSCYAKINLSFGKGLLFRDGHCHWPVEFLTPFLEETEPVLGIVIPVGLIIRTVGKHIMHVLTFCSYLESIVILIGRQFL